MDVKTFLKRWRFTFILLGSVAAGALIGYYFKERAAKLKPFGDVFLNLLFSAVVPLIFFSLSSAIAGSNNIKRLGKIAAVMLIIFAITGIISSCVMLFAVKIFNPAQGIKLDETQIVNSERTSLPEKIVNTISVNNFAELLNRKNILALIVFSILVGLASQAAGEKGEKFRQFLVSGSEVMGQLIKIIMLYAPVGLGAYFAYIVGTFGSQIIRSYANVAGVYYPTALLYFAIAFSFYALIGGGIKGFKDFWKYIWPPAITAFGTGSSLAALPANLEAAKKIGVQEDVREIVLPLGATIHMDGSCLAAVMKIAVLFTIYGRDFSGFETMAGAVGVGILCGVVMSGIPGGGFLGEALIVSLYGFGPEALFIASMIGTVVDSPATMINSSGDTAAAMIVNRFIRSRNDRQ
ncbi:MAG: sodium:proton antiporter [Planctomycetes bacterium GWF2_42_9]|nr:MAG: sodium:proton antiporter [Planctomycetes bacterium GWF2_42_9]HAL44930.1 sodium:proton antiporter [Phycisphaerales bacterium]